MTSQLGSDIPTETSGSNQIPSKSSRRSANDRQWETVRPEIYQLYVIEKNTLKHTMAMMKEKHNFYRSERKYKDKLKEWRMDKYLSTQEMKFIAFKEEVRAKQDGKQTVFYNNGMEISTDRIRNFKKRNGNKLEMEFEPTVATPTNISYHTPRPESELLDLDMNQGHLSILGKSPGTTILSGEDSNSKHLTSSDCFLNSSVDIEDSTFLKRDQMVENALEGLETLATKHKNAGRWEEAACEYSKLLDEYIMREGNKSLSVAETLCNLGYIFQAQKLFKRSVHAYNQAIATFEAVCGSTSLNRLQATVSLAKVFEESGSTHEARELYDKALRGYDEVPRLQDGYDHDFERETMEGHFDCLMYFGDFLCDNQQYIINSSNIYNHDPLRMFNRAIELANQMGSNRDLMIAYGSLIELKIKQSDISAIRQIITDMHLFLEEELEHHLQPAVEVLMEGVHLASIYSDLGDCESAESIFYRVLPKIDLLDHNKYKVEKMYAHLECGRTHNQQRRLQDASSHFREVHNNLRDLERHADFNDEVAMFVNMKNIELNLRENRGGFRVYKDLAQSLETLIQERKALEHRLRETRTVVGDSMHESVEINSISAALSDIERSSNATSNKYGKTFSVSEVTGIDLSEFYEA